MEENKQTGAHSAVAFVQGGIQDACDDACSICLEAFCESDPSTVLYNLIFIIILLSSYLTYLWNSIMPYLLQVTGCKHEFHLQCILEW